MIAQRFAPLLWLLAGLFAARVLAQPAALVIESPLLPRFESWHSGILPYPVLLLSQVALLVWLARTAFVFRTGNVVGSFWVARVAIAFGAVYFVVMLARLLLGLTLLAHVRWFASPIPTAFHLVLATYLLVFGYVHASHARVQGGRSGIRVTSA
ncbi:MAG: hypothetical protein HOP16_01535 [Acidobacteria bacterium]|nr:hypothetical protein [Acidobacteriota bacterium]